jgi:uncharacterized membrane protein YhaH (DUF805 family)
MAEDWELKSLERRIETLEKSDKRRKERLEWWIWHLCWTFLAVALTTMIVLGATGHLHHH